MDLPEVSKILALMAAYDQRKVGESDAMAWSEIIGQFDFDDAKAAVVAFYAFDADRRIMPADIVQFARTRRADRERRERAGSIAQQVEEDLPDADPDDIPAYLAALREGRTKPYDDGTARPRPLRALLSKVFPIPPGGGE